MKSSNKTLSAPIFTIAIALLILILPACGSTPPTFTAVLSAPDSATPLTVGKAVNIVGKVTGAGLKSVDVFVDGVKFNGVDTPTSTNVYDINVPWTPAKIGAHVVQIKGIDEKGFVSVSSDAVFVTVVAASPVAVPTESKPTEVPATAAPTSAPVATSEALITTDQITTTVVATTTVAATTTAPTTSSGPTVSVKEGDYINVRSGPATGYDKIGTLDRGQSIAIKGKNTDGTWWQVNFPTAPGGVGWVFGAVVTTVGDIGSVPTVVSPPTLTPAPTDVNVATPVPPTVTPAPTTDMPPSALLPYSQAMRFSPRDDIGDVPLGYKSEGKSTTLVYEVNGAKSLQLEITTAAGSGIFQNCPVGDLGSISPSDAVNNRINLPVPSGQYPLTINSKGYYLVKIYVVKTDGTTTFIPRNVIVDCYKTQ